MTPSLRLAGFEDPLPAALLDREEIVGRAIPVLRIVRHANVDHLALVNGDPLAGPLVQYVVGLVPSRFAGYEILSSGNLVESEVALVICIGDADVPFQARIGVRQCYPIAQFPVDHLLGVSRHWQQRDWRALSRMIYPLVRADQLTGHGSRPWPGIGSEIGFVERHLTRDAGETGEDI